MLKHVRVDGFRSLVDFAIDLEPGINVIVGANGTGKTNFVSFLDFLGAMIEGHLSSAIADSQGAGAVFSREKFQLDRADLQFNISGEFSTEALEGTAYYYGRVDDGQKGTYNYIGHIIYFRDVPAVLIGLEELHIQITGQDAFSMLRKTTFEESVFKTIMTINPSDHPTVATMYSYIEEIREGRRSAADFLASRLSPEQSFLGLFLIDLPAVCAVAADLTSFRSVNIDPSLARKSTPVGLRQDINSKGEGLAGALYRLAQGNYNSTQNYSSKKHFFEPEKQEIIYKSILSWCREVNPDIKGLRIDLDFQEALLRPYLVFDDTEETNGFSFSKISDGTVKWLALLAVLHIEPSLSVIEEPENFLHPFMQELFVALCRKLVKEDKFRNFLISTHSPTVLDCCSPTELIIFETNGGISKASKVVNHEKLVEKISKSRFGLGHYYRTGGVYGADRSNG